MKSSKLMRNMSGNLGMNLAVASTKGEMEDHAYRGTGGTQLLPFLNQSREETRATKLELMSEFED
jgi:indoleamine 2,3-dioxygenase